MNVIISLAMVMAASGDQDIRIESTNIVRQISVRQNRCYTAAIVNGETQQTVRVTGPEFSLTYGDGVAVSSDAFTVTAVEQKDDETHLRLLNNSLRLHAEISYSAAVGHPWLYKRIVFTNEGDAPFLLRTIDVEHAVLTDESITYSVDPKFPNLGDWGQPVFAESLWFGLEFPAARSCATSDGAIVLRHYPGIEIKPHESYATKRAVVGVADRGRVAKAFMDYVATLTPIPNPPRANIYWNGFRVIKPPNRTEQGVAMIDYARKLKELTGFEFCGWTYDAGFDMYRPDALFVPNEEVIWDKTRDALKAKGVDTPLGFWTSFSPIFDTPTHAWGRTQGFELQHDASYCLAGPTYFAAIRNRLKNLVQTYGMNTINFDGMYWGQGFGCNQSGHGHLVGVGDEAGVYATERVAENKLDIFHELRQINPGIVLDLFVCNEWASPWWLTELDGVHTVAGDTLGCDIPSPWLRDELITVRDVQVFDEHRHLRRQFPLWAEDLYGTQVRSDHLIDGITVTGETMAAQWENEYVMALAGRGAVANHIICSDLRVIDESRPGLRFLGEVAKWVQRNAAIYRNFNLIGGEPIKRQPYGYTHGDNGGRSLVALRNPWIEPRTYALAVDESLDLGTTAEPVYVNIVYPYRATLPAAKFGSTVLVPLQDYAVVLLEVRTASQQFTNVVEDSRWDISTDGAIISFAKDSLRDEPSGKLYAAVNAGGLRLSGKLNAPTSASRAELQVALLPQQDIDTDVTVRIGGRDATYAVHHRERNKAQDTWLLIDAPPGESNIELDIHGAGEIKVGAWLKAFYDLPSQATEKSISSGDDLFPVIAANEDSRITTALPLENYELPLPPLPETATAYVSDLRSRCLSTKVGFFSVGWDKSCWPDDPTLRIGENVYHKGIGVHSPSELVFDIAGAYTRIIAKVGMHGIPASKKVDAEKKGSSAFVIEGDGKTLFTSPVVKEGDAPLMVDVSIAGVTRLVLRTTDGGDSNFDDLATWADVRVER